MIATESLLLREGMKDTALARMAGVSPSTIGRWRKKPDSIPFGAIQKLANAQGLSVKFIRTEREYE